jgi:hypothetical protein
VDGTIGVPTFVVGVVVLVLLLQLLWVVLFVYKRRAERQARSAVGPPRAGVSWLAGRWDTDAHFAYVANVGDATAYEVCVATGNQTIGRADSVPPYSDERMSFLSDEPCYVNFYLDGGSEVAVQVRWRSDQGKWSTQTVRA